MDPNTGKLYPSVMAAKADGVKNPVEIRGALDDVLAVQRRVIDGVEAERRRAARKRAKASRKRNRS